MKLNIDVMLQKMWEYLGLIRIYTKRRGQAPDLTEPVVLSMAREGLTVEAVCKGISKDLREKFNFALLWGRSTKYNPQRVGKCYILEQFFIVKCLCNTTTYSGLSHCMQDEDVIQIVPKTNVQQKRSKDYGAKVILLLLIPVAVYCLLTTIHFSPYHRLHVLFDHTLSL